jgi:glycosyltransferase involved in cell wall biosynthesis
VIYICLPVRDEAGTIGPLLWKLRKVLSDPEFRRDFHVLVLDDASSDDTPAALERYGGVMPLTVLRVDEPLGYGRAVDRLLRHAVEVAAYPKRDGVIVLQADFTEDPAAVVDFVKRLEGGADIVAGTPQAYADDPLPRGVRWARALAPLVLGRAHGRAPVTDPLCGLRAYRVVVLKKATRDEAPLCTADEPWAASLQLLARTAPHARRIEDAPTIARSGPPARLSRFRPTRALKALLRLRRGRRWWEPLPEEST